MLDEVTALRSAHPTGGPPRSVWIKGLLNGRELDLLQSY